MDTKVAVCQITVEDLSLATNYERIQETVEALDSDIELAVFPENALTGFVPDQRIEDAAVSRDSEAIANLRSLATEQELALVVGFVEAAGDTLYNATAYIGAGGELTVYRKRHLWGREKELLTAGRKRVTVDTPAGTAGLLTCYDLNFVDESAALAREEITALIVVGAWPAAYSENWRLLVRARALDGVRWVIGASRTGRRDVPDAPEATFAGRSVVARPDGGVHRAIDRAERTLVTELDDDILARQREVVGVFDESNG
jgi:predicted amidohydrolase